MSCKTFQLMMTITSTVMVFAVPVQAQVRPNAKAQHPQGTTSANTDMDNTQLNIRDRADHSATADKQGLSRSDTEITRRIRREIVKEESLSTYAHNIKIITNDGKVTLKGPVRSEEERRIVENKARMVAGAQNVNSDIGIAGGSK